MLNRSFLCSILLLGAMRAMSQQVIDASGSSSALFDFTLGEVATGGNGQIQLGFLQPQEALQEQSYAIADIEVPCSSTGFAIPIESPLPIASGNVGLDFCFEYDPAVIRPTGTATLGQVATGGNASNVGYLLNTTQPGKVYGIVYFTSSAPANATFNGSGLVISLNFTLVAGQTPGNVALVKLCGITESNRDGQLQDYSFTQTSTVTVTPDYRLTGTVTYWGMASKPLRSGTNYKPTSVFSSDASCDTNGVAITTDANGRFVKNMRNVPTLTLLRDIPGDHGSTSNCTNILTWVNGTDQNLAARIATFDASVTPSVYQMIAADVNLDGRVTAGDVSMLNARSSMTICGFNNNGGGASRDWVFVNASDVQTNPQYAISASYPIEDGAGYSKNRVPIVPTCLLPPVPSSSQCGTLTAGYSAVLLGDVNGNWTTTNSTQLRESEEEYIVLDLTKAVSDSSLGYSVPVFYRSSEPVHALDFYFDLDTTFSKVTTMLKTENTNSFYYSWHRYNNTSLLSSYTMSEIAVDGEVFQVVFDNNVAKELKGKVGERKAFINGKEVALRVEDGSMPATQWSNTVSVHPNPVKDLLTVQLPLIESPLTMTLYSSLGAELGRFDNIITSLTIPMQLYHPGMYTLKIEGVSLNKTYKIVKE